MIRVATREDIIEMANLLASKGYKECLPYEVTKMNFVKGESYLNLLIDSEDGLALVVEVDGRIVGMALAMIDSYWYADDTIAKEILIYIDPDYRTNKYGIKLLKDYIEWAKEKEVTQIIVGASSGVRTEAVLKLYERMGFTNKGYYLTMRNLK